MYKQNENTTFRLEKVKSSKRKAFTLAEVLITIGIIGVVAVLVIVPFMQDIQNKDLATSANVFERRLEQALKVMNTQGTLSGYDTTEEFVEALSKNFKIAKVCNNEHLNQCFKSKFYDAEKNDVVLNDLIFSRQLSQQDWGTRSVGVRFANGISAIMAYNPKCEENPTDNMIPVLNCIAMVYDVNGNGKPNQLSKDVHTINTSTGLGVIARINGVKITGIARDGYFDYVDCSNTESDDYKYCESSVNPTDDIWAGVAKFCGGKENMPNNNDLGNIAKYLYSDDSLDYMLSSVSGLTKDSEKNIKMVSYGFPDGNFKVWSSNSYNSGNHYYRYFLSTSTGLSYTQNNDHRGDQWVAVCVSK